MKFKSNIEIQAGLEDASGSPGTVNQLLSSTATGTAWIDPSTIVAEAATLVVIACKNTSGATIAKGTPVYQTGTVGATATIEIASADALISENKLPAIGLLQTDLNNNGFGNVVITGELTNFTTSPIDGVVPTTGDKVFVKSGGGLTLTKPTGEGNGIQNMGLVGKVSSGNSGSITVSSIMRTNDVPNLPEGRIWVGDGNTIVSDTVYVDEPNNRVGIGTTSPDVRLEVVEASPTDGIVADFVNSTNAGGTIAAIKLSNADSEACDVVLGANRVGANFGSDFFISLSDGVDGSNQERFRITETGNVGIGTTSPGSKLSIDSVQQDALSINSSDGDGPYAVWRKQNVSLGFVGNANALSLSGNTNFGVRATNDLVFATGGASERMRIDSSGNVGIGTTSPSDKLDVIGNATFSGNASNQNIKIKYGNGAIDYGAIRFYTNGYNHNTIHSFATAWQGNDPLTSGGSLNLTGTTATTIGDWNDPDAVFRNGGSTYLKNNVGIGTTSPGTALHVVSGGIGVQGTTGATALTAPGIWMGSDGTNALIYGRQASTWKPTYLDSSALYINAQSGGNVGIGTTSPSEKLDVAGNIKLSGVLYIGSRGIYQQQNTDVSGLELVANASTSLYRAAFFDYVIQKQGNVRAGTVFACNDGTSVEYTETSTNDIGDTSDVVLSVDISGTNMRLLADAATSGWSVKSLIRAI